MLVLQLLCYVQAAKLPFRFQTLAEKARISSQNKVSRESREDTKYPGIYEGDNYRFRLTKASTNSKTNDIKGFAVDDQYIAIVKRKGFSIPNDFFFVDLETQTLYRLKDVIVEKENVAIYKAREATIFDIMTDFEMKVSTKQDFSDILEKEKPTINGTINIPVNWNETSNKPKLYEIPRSEGIRAGLGGFVELESEAFLTFKSFFDISLKINVKIDAKLGVDIDVPSIDKKLDSYYFKNFSIPIKQLSTGFSWLGIDFAFTTTFKHKSQLKDIEFKLPIEFEYFKGYRYIITKTFEFSQYSKTNPDWKVEKTSLHDDDDVKSAIEAFKAATFTGTLVEEGYFKFSLFASKIHTKIHVGYRIPYQLDVRFDDKKCLFPYLLGNLKISLDLFFEFDGLNLFGQQLIDPTGEKVTRWGTFPVGPFCIGKNWKIKEGSMIQGNLPEALIISSSNFVETRTPEINQVEKSIVITIESPTQSIVHSKLAVPFKTFSDQPTTSEMLLVGKEIPYEAEIRWYLKYRSIGGGQIVGTNYIRKRISDIQFDENNMTTMDIPLSRKSGSHADVTNFKVNIQKSNFINAEKVFSRDMTYVTAELPNDGRNIQYGLFTINKDGIPSMDSGSRFRSDCMIFNDLTTTGLYNHFKDSFEIDLNSTTCSEEIERVDVKVMFENSEGKSAEYNSYSTPKLSKGTTDGKVLEINSYFKAYLPQGTKLVFSGNIITQQSNVPFTQTILAQDISPGDVDIKISDSPSVTLKYRIKYANPYLTITSSMDPRSEQEVIAEVVNVPSAVWGTLNLLFVRDETYKILRIPGVPGATKLFIYYTGGELTFIHNDLVTISDNVVVINLNGDGTDVEIPVRCYETEDKAHELKYAFCVYSADVYRITSDGVTTTFNSDIPRMFTVPVIKGRTSFDYIAPDGFQFNTFSFNIDDYTLLYFVQRTSAEDATVTYYSTYTYLEDMSPVINEDLTKLQGIIDKKGRINYLVFNSHNGQKIKADFGEHEFESTISNGVASFSLTIAGVFSFSVICSDASQEICLITYPIPDKSGYHLIKYPNREGISTTGRGFLAEIIHVYAGISFDYFKSYKGAIKTVREYPEGPIDVKLKIEDTDKIEGYSMARKFCLFDGNNRAIPFSRKYISDKIEEFADAMSISLNDVDINYFTNDEDGCIIIHGSYVSENSFYPVNEMVDIPVTTSIAVDNSGVSINPGTVEKPTPIPILTPTPTPEPPKKPDTQSCNHCLCGWQIALIVIGCIIGGAILTLLVLWIVFKCKKNPREPSTSGHVQDPIMHTI